MIKKKLFLAVIFLSWIVSLPSRALDDPYIIPDELIPVPSQAAGVKVGVQQIGESSAISCSYHVMNNAQKPIYLFIVGEGPHGTVELPVSPLHWDHPSPGAIPAGWSATLGGPSQGSTYSMGWQAKTSGDVIQPGHSQDFRMEFPLSDNFHCNQFDWNVRFAVIFPLEKSAPTTLSMTLSNLHVTAQKSLEGDVAIQNTGPNDTMLNLGVMLGNGAKSFPVRLSLVARGPDGQIHKLGFTGLPGGMAGRSDPMMIPLPQQASYTVHARWGAFPELTADEYEFYVEFEGSAARDANADMRGENLLNCWFGKIDSNEVSLEFP